MNDIQKIYEQLNSLEQNGKKLPIPHYYFRLIKKNETCFVQTPHPNGIRKKGIKINELWEKVGKEIRKNCP